MKLLRGRREEPGNEARKWRRTSLVEVLPRPIRIGVPESLKNTLVALGTSLSSSFLRRRVFYGGEGSSHGAYELARWRPFEGSTRWGETAQSLYAVARGSASKYSQSIEACLRSVASVPGDGSIYESRDVGRNGRPRGRS